MDNNLRNPPTPKGLNKKKNDEFYGNNNSTLTGLLAVLFLFRRLKPTAIHIIPLRGNQGVGRFQPCIIFPFGEIP